METNGLDASVVALLECAIHNLKGPAGRLRLCSQLLTRGHPELDEDAVTLLKHIENSAAAVGVVADGLRTFVEICGREVSRERAPLGVLVSGAMAMLQPEIESSGAAIRHEHLPEAEVDRFLMTWVFQELLSNALCFRGEATPDVAISAEDGYVSVADNGPGIEPGMEERAFRAFKKFSDRGGAGLGLTICRKIVELHGGRMWIEPGEGGLEVRFSVGQLDV